MVLLSGAIPGFVPCLNFGSSLTKTACFNKTALEPFQACSSNQLGILGPKLVRIHSLIQAFDFIVTCFLLVQQLLDQLRAFLRLVQGVLERAQILEQVRLSLVVAFLQAFQLSAAGLKLWRRLLLFGILACLHQQLELVQGAAQAIDGLLQAFVGFLVFFSCSSFSGSSSIASAVAFSGLFFLLPSSTCLSSGLAIKAFSTCWNSAVSRSPTVWWAAVVLSLVLLSSVAISFLTLYCLTPMSAHAFTSWGLSSNPFTAAFSSSLKLGSCGSAPCSLAIWKEVIHPDRDFSVCWSLSRLVLWHCFWLTLGSSKKTW